jgi:hypothetical protein
MPKTESTKRKAGLKPGQTNAGSFSKDNPRPGPGRGKRTPVQEAGLAIVTEMERGYSTAEQPDDPPGVKAARLLAHNDYPKFLAMYLKAKELAGAEEPVRVAAEEVIDLTAAAGPKEERVENLILQLLTEWEAEDGQPDPRGRAGEAGGGSPVEGALGGEVQDR